MQIVVLVASSRSSPTTNTIGGSEIVLVNGSTEVISKTGVYDTGIYTLDTSVEATRIIIRRVAEGNGRTLKLAHVHAYQSTNLMLYATVHYATPAEDADHTA